MRNRFKGLDLIECLMNYGQRFVILYRRQGSRPSPPQKKCKKAKWLSEEQIVGKIVFRVWPLSEFGMIE